MVSTGCSSLVAWCCLLDQAGIRGVVVVFVDGGGKGNVPHKADVNSW